MRVVSRLVGVVAVSALVAGAAGAQTCMGYSSLASHKMNLSGEAWFADGATSYGGRLGAAVSSLFLGVGAGVTMYDDIGPIEIDSRTNVNVALGWEKMSGSKLSWCPQAEFGYGKQGDADAEKSIGGRFGLAYEAGGTSMKFIPFGNIGIFKTLDCDNCDNVLVFGGGLGIRFNNGMQISPRVEKTDVEGSDATFGVSVTFPFGKK